MWNVLCRRGLTLLLVGGGGRIGPPASFSALYGKRPKMETWNFLTFPTHSLGMLYQILSFYFAQRRLQDHFLGGVFAKFRPIFFFKISETVKIWLCVMDLFIEKLVLKFGRNRNRGKKKLTILNIWWKTANVIFDPLNPKFWDFGDFRKRMLLFTMREIEWRLPPLK